jgi:acyl-CoA reductase-like NAD-dependent aldehyde dehydrogenase
MHPITSTAEPHTGSMSNTVSPVNETGLGTTQRDWAAASLPARLKVLRQTRHTIANTTKAFTDAISSDLARTAADTIAAEILPLLAACKFLEDESGRILAARRLGRRGLPFWLTGVDTEIAREPFGTVLVIGPANYPLFLPGVQTVQALAAGNAVIWKPGLGGRPVAEVFADAMYHSGLPRQLLQIMDDSAEAGAEALRGRVNKLIFTGSSKTAKLVMQAAAEKMIPCTVEASGCDAVIVLPSADIELVVKAVVFGMRLNGSATCMAPRRLLLVTNSGAGGNSNTVHLRDRLIAAFREVPAARISQSTLKQVNELLAEAASAGATVLGQTNDLEMRPVLVINATPEMEIARADIFAPLLSMIEVDDIAGVLRAQEACPFGLTAAIFGKESEAREVAKQLEVGTVLINDVIVSTADPRIPFGGRRQSGFGSTRGAEGLLEMTTTKVITTKRSSSTRQYDATTQAHERLFDAVVKSSHSATFRQRWQGLKQMVKAGKSLRKS